MSRSAAKRRALALEYPPSEPCSCETCRLYCLRPGWWTVQQAKEAMRAGYGCRMMLEIAPERTFGVLSPAFRGCERNFALNDFADRGCTFLHGDRCELHGTGFQPLECRFCHHGRRGLGPRCHAALEDEWHSPAGRALVTRWTDIFGLRGDLKVRGLGKIVNF
ncbi:MAG TPA: hypothetical protein VMS37_27415 [Verrucomicrobiae bacterium]|nr:hypothetical protein [Verrucomicrobiae bacterium]